MMLPKIIYNNRLYNPYRTPNELFYATNVADSTLVKLFTIKSNMKETQEKELKKLIKQNSYDTV